MTAEPASDTMLRRMFSSLLPAFLALTFLCGTPATSTGEPGTPAARTTDASASASVPVARGNLTQDFPDGAVGPRADQDDNPDDRIVRVAAGIVWPDPTFRTSPLGADDKIRPTHRPCAAPPRGPPIA
jgi:hypothetical protein